MDEENLPGHIALRQPPHLPFPNHLNDLVTLDGSPGSVEGPEALLGVDAPFHGPVVLLNDIVQVRTGATPAPTPQLRSCFSSVTTFGYDGLPLTLITPGRGGFAAAKALRKNCLAAAASRSCER